MGIRETGASVREIEQAISDQKEYLPYTGLTCEPGNSIGI